MKRLTGQEVQDRLQRAKQCSHYFDCSTSLVFIRKDTDNTWIQKMGGLSGWERIPEAMHHIVKSLVNVGKLVSPTRIQSVPDFSEKVMNLDGVAVDEPRLPWQRQHQLKMRLDELM